MSNNVGTKRGASDPAAGSTGPKKRLKVSQEADMYAKLTQEQLESLGARNSGQKAKTTAVSASRLMTLTSAYNKEFAQKYVELLRRAQTQASKDRKARNDAQAQADADRKALDEANKEAAAMKVDKNKYESDLKKLRDAKKNADRMLKKERAALKALRKELQQESAALKALRKELQQESAAMNDAQDKYESDLKELRDAKDKCESELEKERAALEALREERRKEHAVMKAAQDKCESELQKERAVLNALRDELDQSKASQRESDLKHETEIDEFEQKLKETQSELKKLKQPLSKDDKKVVDNSELQKELERVKAAKVQSENELKAELQRVKAARVQSENELKAELQCVKAARVQSENELQKGTKTKQERNATIALTEIQNQVISTYKDQLRTFNCFLKDKNMGTSVTGAIKKPDFYNQTLSAKTWKKWAENVVDRVKTLIDWHGNQQMNTIKKALEIESACGKNGNAMFWQNTTPSQDPVHLLPQNQDPPSSTGREITAEILQERNLYPPGLTLEFC